MGIIDPSRDLNYPDCPGVFHREGKPLNDFRKAWKKACEHIGLDGLFFHDLRRTGVRNLIRAGVSQTVAMKISGHKTDSIFRRYDIVSQEDLKEAARKQEVFVSHFSHSRTTLEKAEEIIGKAQ
ncbi:MAG: tyrosine-type recombinase/integrase [Nitrospinota bacterium]|jgi:integrase|nr:tyrosine-type recombinase/integrase [Nitrospinota bacterium]